MLLHTLVADVVLFAPLSEEAVVPGLAISLMHLLGHGHALVHLVLVWRGCHALFAHLCKV